MSQAQTRTDTLSQINYKKEVNKAISFIKRTMTARQTLLADNSSIEINTLVTIAVLLGLLSALNSFVVSSLMGGLFFNVFTQSIISFISNFISTSIGIVFGTFIFSGIAYFLFQQNDDKELPIKGFIDVLVISMLPFTFIAIEISFLASIISMKALLTDTYPEHGIPAETQLASLMMIVNYGVFGFGLYRYWQNLKIRFGETN